VTPPPAGRASIILSEQSGNALAFPASLVFKGRDLYVTNLSHRPSRRKGTAMRSRPDSVA
jgi:hypothetical protein